MWFNKKLDPLKGLVNKVKHIFLAFGNLCLMFFW